MLMVDNLNTDNADFQTQIKRIKSAKICAAMHLCHLRSHKIILTSP